MLEDEEVDGDESPLIFDGYDMDGAQSVDDDDGGDDEEDDEDGGENEAVMKTE